MTRFHPLLRAGRSLADRPALRLGLALAGALALTALVAPAALSWRLDDPLLALRLARLALLALGLWSVLTRLGDLADAYAAGAEWALRLAAGRPALARLPALHRHAWRALGAALLRGLDARVALILLAAAALLGAGVACHRLAWALLAGA
ncbi:MAG: hypothetical protein L6R48_17780 [Planctomycetes bacterium]|nr:hypothetical protein [Planctomycetota bacterium]